MSFVLSVESAAEWTNCSTRFDYSLYGLRVRSNVRLTLDDIPIEGNADVELRPGDPERFDAVASKIPPDHSDWIYQQQLSDDWTYLRYEGLFEFLVAPLGNIILYRLISSVHLESFQTYALGRVFSFALVKMGFEPLHAATLVIEGRAVAFLGASTFGKSSLAACFIAAGNQLLTDDTLRLEERDDHYVAFPGPPRLRLLPKIARLYLPNAGSGIVMNPHEKDAKAPKLVFCLSPSQSFDEPVPLAAIYVVAAPRKVHRKQKISITPLSQLHALMNVISFTHNDELTNPNRLTRQLDAARRLISKVTIRSLAYPRVLASLDDVRNAVLSDLKEPYVNII